MTLLNISAAARLVRNHPRLFIGLAIGGCTTSILWTFLEHRLSIFLGWDAGILCYLVLSQRMVRKATVSDLSQRASQEDEAKWVILGLMSAASFISILAIGKLLTGRKDLPSLQFDGQIIVGALTVVLSWLLIHTIFAFHYAHDYYGDDGARTETPRGGLIFPQTEAPNYTDFLYYAFVVGMTCQVSDIQVCSSNLRQLTLLHGILSFFFNTIVIAISVNIAAGLL